jgi:MscS family membrane protein
LASKSAAHWARCLGLAILIGLVFCFASAAEAAGPNPLSPLDTSSPRATLQGFIETINNAYAVTTDILQEYAASGRLYLTSDERHRQLALVRRAAIAARAFDFSGISPALMDIVPLERLLQFKEILDRIDLPAFADIPDQEAMTRLGLKRWRLPGTEIDFVQLQDGPRAGEFVVSAETVDRIPEFFEKVKDLPYKPGPARQLIDVYGGLSGGRVTTVYEAFSSSPIGLAAIVPTRWMLDMPLWAKVQVAGVTAWQWLGLGVGLLIGALVVFGSYRLSRRFVAGSQGNPGLGWHTVPLPLAIVLLARFFVPLLCALLRIGGSARIFIDFAETVVFSLGAAWLSLVGSIILGEVMVGLELKRSTLDDQLIRLGTRLVGAGCAIVFLIRGADDLGFPAYSVLAGLGVGGLAVALAARDSLANLLGSLLIMLEKPFRIGHYIRVSGTEGTVVDVGFRSTRIRTPDNSLISIPNNAVVNTTVENLSLRAMRRQRFFVQVTYDTPRDKLEQLAEGIRKIILDHPFTDNTNFEVRFNNFNESSLDVLVMFHLTVEDYTSELREREVILLQIMDLAQELGIAFAFPTRTLQVETAAPATRSETIGMFRQPVT